MDVDGGRQGGGAGRGVEDQGGLGLGGCRWWHVSENEAKMVDLEFPWGSISFR